VGVATIALAVPHITSVRPWEWSAIPLVFLIANFFEWRVHKHVLHKRRPFPLSHLFDQHTPIHHVVYVTDDMAFREPREFALILMPAVGVAGAVLATSPMAYLAFRLVSANCAWLVLLSAALYMVGYELSHLSYHLPASHPIARLGLVQRLRRHHAVHHDPHLMQKWNFNVTIPLADWVMGTVYREAPATTAPRRGSPSRETLDSPTR
jgi:hypothetical protein